jgi:hypothetical protein
MLTLHIEDRDGVTVVRLRRGKVGALDLEVVRAVTAAGRRPAVSRTSASGGHQLSPSLSRQRGVVDLG